MHYLVNNAGVGLYGKFATTDLDAELKMIQLNVTSVVDLTKRFLPSMIERAQRTYSERRVDGRVRARSMDVGVLRDESLSALVFRRRSTTS